MTNGAITRPGVGTITRDPTILSGKPVVAGTRIPVDLVLRHLSQNVDLDDLYAAFPRLTEDDVKACLRYALQVVERERRAERSKTAKNHTAR